MKLATVEERDAVEAFLKEHVVTSMFPLSNLRRYGMEGGHRHALTIWMRWHNGRITDLVAQSEQGMVFPQCPGGAWGEAAVVLAGRPIAGILGHAGQVAALRRFLQLQPASGIDVTEPHYDLPLAEMLTPDCSGYTVRRIDQETRALACSWRADYIREVLDIPGEDPEEKAKSDIDGYLVADSHRFLFEGDRPVAFTGFNAMLPEVVQIGGVYTPPEERSRGLARRAVALHLQEAASGGVSRAILSAASEKASKAYEAIGFRRAGDFAYLMYETPQVPFV